MVKLWRRSNDKETGDWWVVLERALGREHKDLVAYLRTGVLATPTRNPPNADPAKVFTPAELARWMGITWRSVLREAEIDGLKLLRSMTPAERDRFGLLTAGVITGQPLASGWWVQQLAMLPNGSLPWPVLPLARIEEAGQWLGYSFEDLVLTLFTGSRSEAVRAQMEEWVAGHSDRVADILRPEVQARPERWSRIAEGGRALIMQLRPELVAAATSGAKTTRATTRPALALIELADVEDDVKRVAVEGPPASRLAAVELLAELAPDDQRDEILGWIQEHCATDRSEAVRQAVDRLVAADPGGGGGPGEITLPTVDPAAPLPARFGARLERALQGPDDSPAARYMNRAHEVVAELTGKRESRYNGPMPQLLRAVDADPAIADGLAPIHLARAILWTSYRRWWSGPSLIRLLRATGHPTPLELQAAAPLVDVEATVAHEAVTEILERTDGEAWPADEVAAWARHQLPALERYLTIQTDTYRFSRLGLFRALAAVEPRPESLTRALLACGVAGFKADQPLARAALGPSARDLVVEALGSRKVAERVGAAQWLRELRDPTAEPALRAALAREQLDPAKVALLQALDAVGASLDEYLAPGRLAADAAAALAKKNAVPAALEWLPFESLPTVHWNDGPVVEPQIFRWFAASAVKAKSTEPSPLLQRYTASMRPDEVRRYGQALFELWLGHDLRPRPREEAEAAARQMATWKVTYANQYPNVADYARYQGLTVEQVMQLDLPAALAQPAGNALDSKGVLGVVAAMAGPELAPRVLAFVRTWRGGRLHQGKAMLQMLAGIGDPASIQVVLTVAQRFRPASLQTEAATQAQLLAERRGWTVEDLADRTVPRAGFDDDGRQVIDYGGRTFTAHLRDDLSVELVADATSKVIKSLPAARQDEDADEVKALARDLAAARKELKATATLQPGRLFEAMCGGRSWAADDFERYVVRHPVMRRLASRLVWLAVTEPADGDGPTEGAVVAGAQRLFRPLVDGTLLDVDDGEVTLAEGERVLVAHASHVPDEVGERWLEHLADYEVAPLFPQFGRPRPPALDGSVIDALSGHLIDARTLRGATTRHNWLMGQPQDAGIVGWIERPFPGSDLTAVLEINGVPATIDDTITAFERLYYVGPGGAGDRLRAVPLADVPPILLAETYSQALEIAAAGTGYDPDYRKKLPW